MWRPSLRRVLLTCGAVVVATAVLNVVWMLLPADLGQHIPFSMFLLVVAAGALVGGVWPGTLAVVLGCLSAAYIGEPRFDLAMSRPGDRLQLGIFVLLGPLASFGCALLRRTLEDLRRARAETGRLLESERAARAAAERMARLKDEFVGTISHELRTPLTAMLGWAAILRRQELTPERRDRALDVILRNGRALEQIIGDLLDASRMAAGKVRLEMERTSLQVIVEGALDGLRGAARAKRINLRLDLAPVEVFADAGRLQQVIWNLISNAIKFTPAGGSVTVATARDSDGRIELRVRDTGEGIDADLLPHVFERFQQADMSVTRRYGGLGLGLSIARHLVEMHGGTIRAESGGRGKGAELTVILPVPPPDVCTTEHACPPPKHALAGVAVLVVDDDSDGRDLARQILEGQGASVFVAATATEALDALRVCRPGILVSDIGMPDLDGYELIRRLRAAHEAGLAALPAVALTAYARPEDRARALAVGFHEHVPKPFDPATLVSAIKSAYRGGARMERAS